MTIRLKDKSPKLTTVKPNNNEKIHPWRFCPKGYHYVRTHPLRVPPSKSNPDGHTVTRHEHCAKNPHHKDLLNHFEISEITKKHFKNVKSKYKLGSLKEFPGSSKYDLEIQGWVQYWNDVYKLVDPIDPNLIKALMATEPGFKEKTLNTTKSIRLGKAHGLMQIIDQTHKILSDVNGELRDHLIDLSDDELLDPTANICAAIRWLIEKKVTATARLGTYFDMDRGNCRIQRYS